MIAKISNWLKSIFISMKPLPKSRYTIGRRKVRLLAEYDTIVNFGDYQRVYHKYQYSLNSEYGDDPLIYESVVKIKEPVVIIYMEGLDS